MCLNLIFNGIVTPDSASHMLVAQGRKQGYSKTSTFHRSRVQTPEHREDKFISD